MDLKTDVTDSYLKAVLKTLSTGHWLLSSLNRVLKPFELTEPQFNVLALLFLGGRESLCISEIQAGMVQKESNVTRILDRLILKNWVTRKTCPENRRKILISLTTDGRSAFLRANRDVMAFHSSHNLSDEEADLLSTLLDKLKKGDSSRSQPLQVDEMAEKEDARSRTV